MAYMQEISHYPAQGKGQEVQAHLEEWAKSAPSRGFTMNLRSRVGTPNPVFILGVRHETLADYQSARERNRANPAFGAYLAKMQPLMGRRVESALFQGLVPPAREAPRPKFQFQISRYPAQGKWLELRALLEERAKAQSPELFRTLRQQVFGSEGPVLVTTIGFQDMASLEANLEANQRDPKFRAYVEKVESLTARPSKTDLFQVLVPLPIR